MNNLLYINITIIDVYLLVIITVTFKRNKICEVFFNSFVNKLNLVKF